MNFKQRIDHIEMKFDELEDYLLAHGLTEEQLKYEVAPIVKDALKSSFDWLLAGFMDYLGDKIKECNHELYSEIYSAD